MEKKKNRLFENHSHAEVYAKYRVSPPLELIERIMTFLKDKYSGQLGLAVDVGCGSGQNTFLLAKHFDRVLGSDVSHNQVEFAKIGALKRNLRNIEFEVKPAEAINAGDSTVQLVTAAEAFHWFDIPRFFDEAMRVLCPGGVIALTGYVFHKLHWERDPSKSGAITKIHEQMWIGEPLYDLWAWQNREILFNMYNNIPLPFDDVIREMDSVNQERQMTLNDLGGEIETWSAFQQYCATNGEKAGLRLIDGFKQRILDVIREDLNEEEVQNLDLVRFRVKTPFFLLMGRKSSNASN